MLARVGLPESLAWSEQGAPGMRIGSRVRQDSPAGVTIRRVVWPSSCRVGRVRQLTNQRSVVEKSNTALARRAAQGIMPPACARGRFPGRGDRRDPGPPCRRGLHRIRIEIRQGWPIRRGPPKLYNPEGRRRDSGGDLPLEGKRSDQRGTRRGYHSSRKCLSVTASRYSRSNGYQSLVHDGRYTVGVASHLGRERGLGPSLEARHETERDL